jgi:hypothetical protein
VGKVHVVGDGQIRDQHATHERGDEGCRRPFVNLGWRADLLNVSTIHHRDAVRHDQSFSLVVGDEQGGDAETGLNIADLTA